MALLSSNVTLRNLTGKLKLGERFSCGGYSVVYKAVLSNAEYPGTVAAVKFLDLHRMWEDRAKAQLRWEREMRAGQRVVHPNVLLCLGVCENPDPNYQKFVGIVLPFYVNGDMNTFIEHCPHADRMRLLSGVAAGIFAIHSAHDPVVHGDIKAANILVDDNENPRLADFGLSRICGTKGFTTQTVKGSWHWMAVELILTGKVPFDEIKSERVFLAKMYSTYIRPQKPSSTCIPDALWKALERCWDEDASKRPTPPILAWY
ncbi:kinase-like protein [Fomitiporia mediterranea MF3/22]|uniref:kinase-like protein n=1 Tax=Fomitiporia mediterranea (strain MF3/22) TaxID=694068 RepID=UPI00044087C1|nr:kinase-like protein [Fomitiporia mediterranea MF3/22]EJD07001.1 kinase-like protein [Fomitiporia mediterranea MF3/22]